MKLKLYGDLSYFWQWDLNRKLVVEDDGVCSQVHFCNGTGPALVCPVRDENGLRVADVPNILLQKAEQIKAYLYTDAEDGSRTRRFYRFDVLARSRPEEYIYTETEVLNYAYLDERLRDLEGEGLANAVAEYLEENPVEAGATKEEAAQIQQNKESIENLTKGKLDAEKLPEAVNDALEQAKASGEFDGQDGQDGYTPRKGVDYFDGEPGEDGEDGFSPVVSISNITGGHRITIKDANGTKTVDIMDGSDGQDGQDGKNGNGIKSAVLNSDYTLTLTFDNGTKYTTPSIRGAAGKDGTDGQDGKTPVKGVDYFDGQDGQDGKDGTNGTSATHSWNGTTLTITSASGTSSADLKGDKGDTPIRGKDYWTETDKAEIKSYVDEAILGGVW